MKAVNEYMDELIELLDQLKGVDTMLTVFYERCVFDPNGQYESNKDEYIKMLSFPYITIMQTLKNTIRVIDNMTDDMSMPAKNDKPAAA